MEMKGPFGTNINVQTFLIFPSREVLMKPLETYLWAWVDWCHNRTAIIQYQKMSGDSIFGNFASTCLD